jgi:hypothetical protein
VSIIRRSGQSLKGCFCKICRIGDNLRSLQLSFTRIGTTKKLFLALTPWIAIISTILLVQSIVGQNILVHTIQSHGTVKVFGLGVYWDSEKTTNVTSIDWGLIEPNVPSSVIVYIANEGNYPTYFSLTAENWIPEEASNYFSLSWDYNGQKVNPGETVRVTLSLLLSSGIQDVKSFGFGIIIADRDRLVGY